MKEQNQECCPKFDMNKWEEKNFDWDNKLFIKETIPTFFHIPFPPMIGRKMKKMMKLTEKADATYPDLSDMLVCFHDPSAFKSNIFISVTKNVDGANNTSLSGNFVSKTFDGHYNSIPKHIKTMQHYLSNVGKTAKDFYVHYAYCPKCAKKYGHNYMVLFAET